MDQLNLRGGSLLFVKAGLTGISGAATTYSTGATTLQYSVQGKAATKAQVSGGASPTTDINTSAAITLTAVSTGRVVVWGLNLAGTVVVAAGPIEALDSAGNFINAPQFPALPDNFCPFAYHLLKAGSTLAATFTFGTSNWNATGMSHVVVDTLPALPDRPQTS